MSPAAQLESALQAEAEQASEAPALLSVSTVSGETDVATESARAPGASSCAAAFCQARAEASEPVLAGAQRRWAARSVAERIEVLRSARKWMAAHPHLFSDAVSGTLQRTPADTLVTELLPLLDAMRFLERRARKVLAPRRLGRSGRPLWLTGVHAEIRHEPLGHIAVIGPANFPLFLPSVQVLQALLAGNAVTWKPGTGGTRIAVLVAHALRQAELPRGVLHVTDDSVDASKEVLARRPDKVVFTGSFEAGQHILQTLAKTATPAVMELSGADAVVVLPSADLPAVAKAVAFGLRLNGSAVCMSPRRLVATRETLTALNPLLRVALDALPPAAIAPRTATRLEEGLRQAVAAGAQCTGWPGPGSLAAAECAQEIPALLVENANPAMPLTRTDLFAPVLSLIEAPSVLHMPALVNDNPYGLTAAIFGDATEAESLASELRVGTVIVNDLIAPTADPRIPFGGRGRSGFGLTRGAEGLLEMTAAKVLLRRTQPSTRHYDPLGPSDASFMGALIGVLHGGSLRQRVRSLRNLVSAARNRPR